MLPIRFLSSLDDLLPDEGEKRSVVSGAVMDLVRDAIDHVLPRPVPAFLARVDLVAEGPTAQMTPLVSPEGVVVRLDLSICDFFLWNGIDGQRDHLKSILYHEFYHLCDRLDPGFGFDYHEDATRAGENRRMPINAVWDVSIERRKLDTFSIPPFATFAASRKRMQPRDAVLDNLRNLRGIIGADPSIEEVFTEIWDTRKGKIDYSDLVRLAGRLHWAPASTDHGM